MLVAYFTMKYCMYCRDDCNVPKCSESSHYSTQDRHSWCSCNLKYGCCARDASYTVCVYIYITNLDIFRCIRYSRDWLGFYAVLIFRIF